MVSHRYTVNLVVFFIDKKLAGSDVSISSFNFLIFLVRRRWGSGTDRVVNADLPDRTAASLLLPLSTKDKDSKSKEENHKLLNGISGDPADRV